MRVITPTVTTSRVLDRVRDDPTVANVVVVHACAQDGEADLVMFDLARESADPVLASLRELGLEHTGSIAFDEAETLLSDAASRAERAAPGRPADGVIWETIEVRAKEDAAISFSFVTFLVLATLLAGIGRYLDQPIIIVGAMVVGPEFAPLSALCYGLARRAWHLVPPATLTLVAGMASAGLFGYVVWLGARLLGIIDRQAATTGAATQFIIHPDGWSFVIALLAGTAGTLSLTAAKSSTLVGVFISVTTVPALGTAALTAAVGAWGETAAALTQLGLNLAGLVIAGTLTMLVQQTLWRHVASMRPPWIQHHRPVAHRLTSRPRGR